MTNLKTLKNPPSYLKGVEAEKALPSSTGKILTNHEINNLLHAINKSKREDLLRASLDPLIIFLLFIKWILIIGTIGTLIYIISHISKYF